MIYYSNTETINPCVNQGYTERITGTLHVADIRFAAPSHLYHRVHFVCTYFIYWDNMLSLHNHIYFLSHYKCYWGSHRLDRMKI